jgi:hypothetical protein
MLGWIDVTWSKVAHQKLLIAEYIQRQKTVLVVIPMEESALLFLMNSIVGHLKINNKLLGSLAK